MRPECVAAHLRGQPRVLTLPGFAKLIGVAQPTARQLLEDGVIDGFRLRDRPRAPWRVPRVAVERYLSDRA